VKLLVTGATGFLGSTLVPLLLEQGHAVRALQRGEASIPGAEVIKGDVRDEVTVRKALQGIEGVYHLAGLVSRDPADARKMYELHVDGTRNLFAEAVRAGVQRVVLASSSGTVGVSKTRRVAVESDDYPIETVGRWPYYLSKIYEEKIAIEASRSLPVVILNPSLLLGPGDARLSSTQDVFRFLQGRIPATPRGGLSFVDVRDAAAAFVSALTRGNPGERHFLGGANWEFDDFFARLARIAHRPRPRLGPLPARMQVAGAHLMERLARERGREPDLPASDVEMGQCWFFIDSSKAERLLGFHARDPLETLSETVHYVREHFIA
jgi:dihydroflavonol-4-reductase